MLNKTSKMGHEKTYHFVIKKNNIFKTIFIIDQNKKVNIN